MPNCFSLTRKSDRDAGPVPLGKINDEMCAHFGVPVDPDYYYHERYGIVGFALAMGKTFADCREEYRKGGRYPDSELLAIVNWFDENFSADAWVEVGRSA